MQRISWSTALILLAVLLLVPSVWAAGLPTPQLVHPAGCHQHGPMLPSPAPVSHQCCTSGHQWAIAATNFSPDRPVALSLRLESDNLYSAKLSIAPANSLFTLECDLLPNSSPLRI
jgi:hypothetical protein